MIGWVAKDNHSYSFSVKKYGPKGRRAWAPDVGNGVRTDGSGIKGNDPLDTSIRSSPEFIEEAVRLVVEHAGPAQERDGKRGVAYWVLTTSQCFGIRPIETFFPTC